VLQIKKQKWLKQKKPKMISTMILNPYPPPVVPSVAAPPRITPQHNLVPVAQHLVLRKED
jgi:hypothetical protein